MGDLIDDGLDDLDGDEIRHAWPQTLVDMVASVEAALRRDGVSDDEASRWAVRAVRAVALMAGGRQIYIPTGEQLDRAVRDREIWRKFKGNNIPALAREYGMSERRIYNIVRAQRALDVARRPSLALDEPRK